MKNADFGRENRGRRCDECQRRERKATACRGLRPNVVLARGAQHRREFGARGAIGLRAHHADFGRGSSPPIVIVDRRESTKNITPTATIVADRIIGSVNPSAITDESASRNCSVE